MIYGNNSADFREITRLLNNILNELNKIEKNTRKKKK